MKGLIALIISLLLQLFGVAAPVAEPISDGMVHEDFLISKVDYNEQYDYYTVWAINADGEEECIVDDWATEYGDIEHFVVGNHAVRTYPVGEPAYTGELTFDR